VNPWVGRPGNSKGYGNGNRKSNSKSKMRGFFPFVSLRVRMTLFSDCAKALHTVLYA
jgi:hypothetical protein